MERPRLDGESIQRQINEYLKGPIFESVEYIEAMMKLDAKYSHKDPDKYEFISRCLVAGYSIAGMNIFDFLDWQDPEIRERGLKTQRLGNISISYMAFKRFENWNYETDPYGFEIIEEKTAIFLKENESSIQRRNLANNQVTTDQEVEQNNLVNESHRLGAQVLLNYYKTLFKES